MTFPDTYPNGQAAQVVNAASAPLGNSWVFLGDSVTASAWQNSTQTQGMSFALWTQFVSGGRIHTVRNAGVAGDTSSDMLARFNTDVTPYAPKVVFLVAGTNDIGGGAISFATFKSNIEKIRRKCIAIGAALALGTIPPNNDAPRKPFIIQWNQWLRRYAAANALSLIDIYTLLVDSTNGNYLAAYNSGDGTHPNNAGLILIAQTITDELMPLTREWSPALVGDANDTTTNGFSTNPLLISDANADGIPDGWVAFGGVSGFAHALVTDAAVPGKMMQITQTANATIRVLERSLLAGTWSVGDRLYFAAVITSDGGVEMSVRIQFVGATTNNLPYAARFTAGVTRGIAAMDVVIPPGTTTVSFDVIAGAGTGVIAAGQPTLLNLTRLGY